jgi:hypothetical protein
MYPHRIRLRGPWECEPLSRRAQNISGQTGLPLPMLCHMTMPCRWGDGGLAGFAGRVRFRRRFGIPRQLDAHERVWLTFGGVNETAEVWLNERFLGRHAQADQAVEFEVTALLRERNQLVVDVEASDDRGGLWGEVALEVRCAAFLRSVSVRTTMAGETARLHVSGKVAGKSDGPLEVYLVLDRFTVGYATVAADPNGRPFEVISDPLPLGRLQPSNAVSGLHELRIDLVNGATVWFAVERRLTIPDRDNSLKS